MLFQTHLLSPETGRKAASVWHDGVSKIQGSEWAAGVRILGIFTAMQEILIPSVSWTQSIGKKDSFLLKFRRIFEGTGEKTLYISEQEYKQRPWVTDQF